VNSIHVGCELNYRVKAPTSFLFNIAAATSAYQRVTQETMRVEPDLDYEIFHVGGEQNRTYRLHIQGSNLKLSYQATVELNPEVDDPPQIPETEYPALPGPVLPYLNPSRYCESDRLARFAEQEFGHLLPGYSRVTAICNWTYQHLEYVAGSSNASTSACDVLIQRAGVCRDYAHLAIALCRALGIPARYVAGYAVNLEPADFHGFLEAYLGTRWYLFDATRMAPLDGLVRIGMGRDAADASFATIIGAADLENMTVFAQEAGTDPKASHEDAAISTSG
jgi:transglutaminase-like putative cysteine protease